MRRTSMALALRWRLRAASTIPRQPENACCEAQKIFLGHCGCTPLLSLATALRMQSAIVLRSNRLVVQSRPTNTNKARQPWLLTSVLTAPHARAIGTAMSPEVSPAVKAVEPSATVSNGHSTSPTFAALLSDSNNSSGRDTATARADIGSGGAGSGGSGGGDGGEGWGSEDSDEDTPDETVWVLLLAILVIPAYLVWGDICKLLHPCPHWQPPLPVSGTEPAFNEQPWCREEYAWGNNCYSYAIGDARTLYERPTKARPGDRAQESWALSCACSVLFPLVLADNPGDVYVEAPSVRCRPGHHKIMLFSDSGGGDFHFSRQHRDVWYKVQARDSLASIAAFLGVTPTFLRKHNPRAADPPRPGSTLLAPGLGLWSHKLGHGAGALLADGRGKAIRDPRKACRQIEDYDYQHFCGAFCVRTGAAQSGIIYNSRVEMPCMDRGQKKTRKKSAQQCRASASPWARAPASSASLSWDSTQSSSLVPVD